jgi:tRNA-2-methylthio-N6-dimethylallyladenosine synthase
MYDNNPTLQLPVKTMVEGDQGKVYGDENFTRQEGCKYFYIESYGCQMNFSDSEIVASILAGCGYQSTRNVAIADLIFINTCSIREKAEETVRKRLAQFNQYKVGNPSMLVGVLGCMAERLKSRFLEEEKLVDLVVGPDAYRDFTFIDSHRRRWRKRH